MHVWTGREDRFLDCVIVTSTTSGAILAIQSNLAGLVYNESLSVAQQCADGHRDHALPFNEFGQVKLPHDALSRLEQVAPVVCFVGLAAQTEDAKSFILLWMLIDQV